MLKRLLIAGCVILGASPLVFAGDDVPSWLRQAAAQEVPAYDKDVQAVVLVNEQRVTVSADGQVSTERTFAVRILTHEGRGNAVAAVPYLTDSGKVRDMHAWLIRASGEVKRFGKDEIFDVISDPNDIYNELRLKTVIAKDAADTGAVFGYQATTEERSIFGEDEWSFQNRLPTLMARYALTLPAGWTASSITFNHARIEPQVNGTSYAWQLNNLAPIQREPASPEVTNLAARLAVSYIPPAGGGRSMRTFANWTDVSRFVSELQDPQSAPNDAVTAKARELTANSKTEFERIQSIGNYVQHLKYISIDIGVGHGGGIRPHAAAEVFAKSYGDCKDKANLMRAMLRAINITAYPVAIYLGDRTYVREEWASPQQFNHCIIAVKVSDETQAATILQHPRLGRLLIFDATDDDTLLGDLPTDEQGSFALIVARDDGGLMRMPSTPPEANRLDRQIDAALTANGSLTASVREKALGQWGVGYRSEFRHLARPDYVRQIEGWLTAGATGARVGKIEPTDNPVDGSFSLNVEFAAPAYGQLMQGRLMVFKPVVVSRRELLYLTSAKRKHPVVLTSNSYSETVRMKLPEGFAVDEMPDAVKLDTGFGSYATSYEVKDGELVFSRKLVQRAATIPVEQYNSVRSFFEKIRAAEQAPVVLMRK